MLNNKLVLYVNRFDLYIGIWMKFYYFRPKTGNCVANFEITQLCSLNRKRIKVILTENLPLEMLQMKFFIKSPTLRSFFVQNLNIHRSQLFD
jgi:hypothetical protein